MSEVISKSEEQVKSKKRVTDHGEVFTSEREVNSMLDLVKQETERIESRFLEPACGNGNFLIEVLKRKLEVVSSRYKNSQLEWERYAVTAVSSIYGVDILQDNVAECRERLMLIFDEIYTKSFKNLASDECRNAIRFLLSKNILWGDALSLKTPNEESKPIIFSEWSPINGSFMKRRDFTLANLLQGDIHHYNKKISRKDPSQMGVFSDEKDDAFLPKSIQEFPPTHFLKLHESEN
jgi:SAM-dependent methyltransferase